MPGLIFYRGKSRLDLSPIVGIATYGSHNPKTGDLVQSWILRSDVNPIVAINTGEDKSICGNCPMRGRLADASERIHPTAVLDATDTVNKGRSCYVLVQNAPLNIYKFFKKGLYPKLGEMHREILKGKGLRYGSYGDPVAIPMKYWDKLLKYCTGKSEPGYTHQWKLSKFNHWNKRLMASTHSEGENLLAHSKGWRTFRTILDKIEIADNEIICPASKEGGFKATCETCGACDGRRSMKDLRKSIAIVAHGGEGKKGFIKQIVEKSEGKFTLTLV